MQLTPLSTHWEPRKKNKKKGTIFFGHGVFCLSDMSKKTASDNDFVVVTLGKCIAQILKNIRTYKRKYVAAGHVKRFVIQNYDQKKQKKKLQYYFCVCIT